MHLYFSSRLYPLDSLDCHYLLIIGDTGDSRFEMIIDEIMDVWPPTCAHHNTLIVPISL